jgi:glycosyltransferase involved in cell wall biosynthesis
MFRLESLPETVLYYPIPGITIESLFERIIHKYYLKKEKFNFKWVRKLIEKIYEQELRRIFGDTKIDWFVHYTGFDRKYAEMVKYIPTKTVMFVHTDMFKDYENKKNYNKKVVYNAYRAATKIALVNENLKEGFKKNLPDLQNKLVVVNNFLGEDRIRKLSEENVISTLLEVKFDSVDSSHINVDPIKRYSELIKCCEQKYKNDYKQIKGLQIEFMEKSISNHIRTQIVNELSEKGVELAQIEKEIMMEINDKFKIINEDHIKEELLNTDVLKAYISNKMKEKYLNKNFEYRNKLISLLKEYTDVPVSTVDNILYKEIRNSEVKRLFPYFFTLLPLYIEAAGITSNELGGNNNCEGDGSSANISSINENSILDIIIDKFGISKMRMLNEILDPNITTFLNIGRYDLQKGHERLINAFEKFNYDYPDSRLIIIAPYGPIRNRTINRVKQSTAKKNIYLLGRMNNPYALLKMVDAFVLSSFYEGLGLVVYEALSLGTQVITVNLKTTTE